MPIFDFECRDCNHTDEHFVYFADDIKLCPKCNSAHYIKMCSEFKLTVEYSNPQESYEKNIAPHIESIYQNIGKEAMSGDTKTLNDVFGEGKVNHTYTSEPVYESD